MLVVLDQVNEAASATEEKLENAGQAVSEKASELKEGAEQTADNVAGSLVFCFKY